MHGAENDEPALAEHLSNHAPLGLDGREALRMANAEYLRADQKISMQTRAVEIAMQELLRKAT